MRELLGGTRADGFLLALLWSHCCRLQLAKFNLATTPLADGTFLQQFGTAYSGRGESTGLSQCGVKSSRSARGIVPMPGDPKNVASTRVTVCGLPRLPLTQK